MTNILNHDIRLIRKQIAVYFKKEYYRTLLKMNYRDIMSLWSVLKGRVK